MFYQIQSQIKDIVESVPRHSIDDPVGESVSLRESAYGSEIFLIQKDFRWKGLGTLSTSLYKEGLTQRTCRATRSDISQQTVRCVSHKGVPNECCTMLER